MLAPLGLREVTILTCIVIFWMQIRGSIPVLWEQIVDLTYKPKIKAMNYEDTV
jgi:hypothetical protein